jgi:anti-sigma regulatory factor (Ser/Thr protein kinase)
LEFDVRVSDDLPPVAIAPHALAQAVINLINNARDAIGSASAGRVVLRAVEADDDMVRIVIEDNGPGMPAEVRARAIEPFFTTKTRRLSTGLGLSLVHGIMNAVGGSVEIESPVAQGRGTAISLIVPAIRRSVERRLRAARNRSVMNGVGNDHSEAVVTESDEGSSSSSNLSGTLLVWVSVQQSRAASLLTHVLQTFNCRIEHSQNPPPVTGGPKVWLTDPHPQRLSAAQKFLSHDPGHIVIVTGEAPPEWREIGVIELKHTFRPSAMREVLTPILDHAQAIGEPR